MGIGAWDSENVARDFDVFVTPDEYVVRETPAHGDHCHRDESVLFTVEKSRRRLE